MDFLKQHRSKFIQSVFQAGQLIVAHSTSDKGPDSAILKDNGTPVTIVDRLAEDIIVAVLETLTPNIPIIAEERFADHQTENLNGRDTFWLVDALDGTKEFILGTGEYTVNLALIHKGQPVYGLIYAPERGMLYEAQEKLGSFSYSLDIRDDFLLDDWQARSIGEGGKKLALRPIEDSLILVTSARQKTSSRISTLFDKYKIAERKKCGSSLKFCMIASGQADVYPRFGPTCEWDTAAGDIIMREAGGVLIDMNSGKHLAYVKEDRKFLNPHFIAVSVELYHQYEDAFTASHIRPKP